MSVAASTFNVLSLCAGGGGLDLGVRLALRNTRTVGYVENEVTACGVLAARMEDGGLDDAPLWTDLRSFDGRRWRGVVDLVIGGYPCQPFSNAGKRLGAEDPRHLWPEVERVVREVEPEWCFFENVGAHLRLGFREVAGSLHAMGYRVAAVLLTASEVGAPHGRERLLILAHREGFVQREPYDGERAESWCDARQDAGGRGGHGIAQLADTERGSGGTEPRIEHQERPEVSTGTGRADYSPPLAHTEHSEWGAEAAAGVAVAYRDERGRQEAPDRLGAGRDRVLACEMGTAHLARLEGRFGAVDGSLYELPAWPPGPEDADAWRRIIEQRPDLAPATEPPVRGMADGLAGGLGRSDQLHILGNGVVPQQAAYAMTMLIDALTAKE